MTVGSDHGPEARPEGDVVRLEWAGALTLGLVTATGGALAVHRCGGRPALAVGFLLMPSVYVTLATRESLVLCRAAYVV